MANAQDIQDLLKRAQKVARKLDTDVYLYNGGIERKSVLSCLEEIFKKKKHDSALLILVTGGGSPDAAYKIARYFQEKYDKFSILVSGWCKSAGTLIAIGAHELVFSPFGELGPLDIQLGKVDKFDAPQSGLIIQESLDTLEARAMAAFYSVVAEYMSANGGLLSFQSATAAATKFVTDLYAPILSRIDPEEVGDRSRSMRVAHEYGKRLDIRSRNLKPDALKTLSEKYPSHSFVIDQVEAQLLFNNVRGVTEVEKELVSVLGALCRVPVTETRSAILFKSLSFDEADEDLDHGQNHQGRGALSNGENSSGNGQTPKSAPRSRAGQTNGRAKNGKPPSRAPA